MKDSTITEAREMICAASNEVEELRSKLDPRLLRIYEQRLDYLEDSIRKFQVQEQKQA